MLYHHANQDYNVAASEAAKSAREKFEAEIERGKQRTLAVIEQVHSQVPQDRIVTGSKLDFYAQDKQIKVVFPDGEGTTEGFHRHVASGINHMAHV